MSDTAGTENAVSSVSKTGTETETKIEKETKSETGIRSDSPGNTQIDKVLSTSQIVYFDKSARQILVTMFNRVPNKNDADVTAWQRLLRIQKSCNNEEKNLRVMFQFPPRKDQLKSDVVGMYTTDNGAQFYKGQNNNPVDPKTISKKDKELIVSYRSNAAIVFSAEPCRFKSDTVYFQNDDRVGSELYSELLFFLEITKGDLQIPLTNYLSLFSNRGLVYVEVPKYWDFYFRKYMKEYKDGEKALQAIKLKRDPNVPLEGANDDIYVYYKFRIIADLTPTSKIPAKPDDLHYATDPAAMTLSEQEELRSQNQQSKKLSHLQLTVEPYTNEKQAPARFEADYNGIMSLNDRQPVTNANELKNLKTVHGHMLRFALANMDKKMYIDKVLAVENKFIKLGMPVEDSFATWYKNMTNNPIAFESLPMLRHYTSVRNRNSEQIMHEKKLLVSGQLNNTQRSDIIHYIWNHFMDVNDIKNVPLTNEMDVKAIHDRMDWLRKNQHELHQSHAIALQNAQAALSQNKSDKGLQMSVKTKEEELMKLDEKAALLERAFRESLAYYFEQLPSAEKTREKQKLLQSWIDASVNASRNGWPTKIQQQQVAEAATAQTASIIPQQQQQQQVQTLNASPNVDAGEVNEILKNLQRTINEAKDKEQEEIMQIAANIKRIFVNMTATYKLVQHSIQQLIEQDTLDPKKVQTFLMEANKCYRSGVSIAVQSGIAQDEDDDKTIQKNRTTSSSSSTNSLAAVISPNLQEMRSYFEIIKSNDKCLINYKATLQIAQEESNRLFQENRLGKLKSVATIVNKHLEVADKAIMEVKTLLLQKQSLTTGTVNDLLKASKIHEARIQIMEDKRNKIDAIHQFFLTANVNSMAEWENDKGSNNNDNSTKSKNIRMEAMIESKIKESQQLLEEIVAQLLELKRQIENPEDIESLLVLQQLKGSELDVREARRKAQDAANLAVMYHKNMQLAEAAQKKAIQDATLINNPFRRLSIEREDIERREKRQNETQKVNIIATLQQLKRLLADKTTSIDTLNSAVNKLDRLFEINQHNNSPELLSWQQEARELKLQVIKRQQQKENGEEEEENNDEQNNINTNIYNNLAITTSTMDQNKEEKEEEEEEEEEEENDDENGEGDEGDDDEEEEFNVDEDENLRFDEKEDLVVAIDELEIAIDNEEIKRLPHLIRDVEMAEKRAGIRTKEAASLIKAARSLLKRK